MTALYTGVNHLIFTIILKNLAEPFTLDKELIRATFLIHILCHQQSHLLFNHQIHQYLLQYLFDLSQLGIVHLF